MAATRAAKNKEVRREALREELKSREYLRQVHHMLEIPWDNVPEMKAKMDGYFKLLAKTLPDVKAVELSGEDGQDMRVSFKIIE